MTYAGGGVKPGAPIIWPGIDQPWCRHCSWAWYQGRMQIKLIHRMCPLHAKHLPWPA